MPHLLGKRLRADDHGGAPGELRVGDRQVGRRRQKRCARAEQPENEREPDRRANPHAAAAKSHGTPGEPREMGVVPNPSVGPGVASVHRMDAPARVPGQIADLNPFRYIRRRRGHSSAVERQLPKLDVAGSIPVARSTHRRLRGPGDLALRRPPSGSRGCALDRTADPPVRSGSRSVSLLPPFGRETTHAAS